MAQTRMFRDRVVSMEQTLEGGEKHLELLKALCIEAIPDFPYAGHVLDHERDLFVMELQAPDGRRKTVAFTRMVLYDAERLPSIVEDPSAPVREKLVHFLKSRAARPDIVVTFRHLEDGFVDTPEAPRPSRRRGRRGGRGGKGPSSGRGMPGGAQGRPAQQAGGGRPGGPGPGRPAGPPPPGGGAQATVPGGAPGRSGRRRRSRRRRRGGGAGPAGGAPGGNPQGAP
jgi:hypothetical protein